MKRISLRTCLWAVALLAVWLATIKQFGFEPRIFRGISLIKVEGLAPSQAVVGIASRAATARALADPVVASLPSVRALADPVTEVGRQVTALVRPQTALIEVGMNWGSGSEAAAIVNKVVADAIDAAPPGALRRVNFAIGGAPFRRSFAPVPCALITLAAAMAIVLVFVGPGLTRKASSGSAPRAAGGSGPQPDGPTPRPGSITPPPPG